MEIKVTEVPIKHTIGSKKVERILTRQYYAADCRVYTIISLELEDS